MWLIRRLLLPLSLLPLPALAADEIAALLALPAAPAGVVFEIAGREGDLEWAVPRLRDYTARLRQRFPLLPIAVVSHGREQFALLQAAAPQQQEVQQGIQALAEHEEVSVHVCGVNAERRGTAPEEFVPYIDVAAEGPAQIRDYEALGYIRVRLRR